MLVIYLMLEVYKIKAMTTDLSEFARGGGGGYSYISHIMGVCAQRVWLLGFFGLKKGYTLCSF